MVSMKMPPLLDCKGAELRAYSVPDAEHEVALVPRVVSPVEVQLALAAEAPEIGDVAIAVRIGERGAEGYDGVGAVPAVVVGLVAVDAALHQSPSALIESADG